ncbi:MAG: GtrA family protein [Treponema sp.]|nr:GtrA family protein [Treponema sp.]
MEKKTKRLLGEFIKFGLTGVLGTVTNLSIFFLGADILKFHVIPVSIFCFLGAGTQNYFINHIWSFKEYTGGEKIRFRKWLQFLSGSLTGLLINILVMQLVLYLFNPPYKFIAQAMGIAAGMVINFTISKFFVFRKKPEERESGSDE